MPLILGTNSIKDTGYNVDNSVRFDDGSGDELTRSQGSSPSSRRLFTFSAWVKRSSLNSGGSDPNMQFFSQHNDTSDRMDFRFQSGDTIDFRNDSPRCRITTSRLFRDVSAFYHICLRVDTTQSTASNRIRLYINGVQETSFSSEDYGDQNDDLITNASTFDVGDDSFGTSHFDGYMCEVVYCDGQSLDPTSFGEFDSDSPNIWKPIDVSGLTFGTNGFYLDFKNASNLGADVSGNSNNFTVNNLTSIDQSTDTCTNNFCTLSTTLNTDINYSEGALKGVKASGDGNQRQWGSTFAVNSGKWYWECKNEASSTNHWYIGIIDAESIPHSMTNFPGDTTKSYGIRGSDGHKLYNASASSYGSAISNGDVVMIALDLDNKKIWFGENGTFFNSGDPAGGSNEAFDITDGDFYMPSFTSTGGGGEGWFCNFGSPAYSITSGNADGNGFGNFEYAPPSGFLSLCSKNLGENS